MKQIIRSLFISAVLIFNALFISQITFAQDTPAANDPVNQPGTAAVTDGTGFNPLWLLPIIAIPLLAYLLWPRDRDEEAQEAEYGYGTDLAGAKGGKASRNPQKTEPIEDD